MAATTAFSDIELFVFFMLMLVLANNYLLCSSAGRRRLCSYLLIGFYFHRKSPATRPAKRSS